MEYQQQQYADHIQSYLSIENKDKNSQISSQISKNITQPNTNRSNGTSSSLPLIQNKTTLGFSVQFKAQQQNNLQSPMTIPQIHQNKATDNSMDESDFSNTPIMRPKLIGKYNAKSLYFSKKSAEQQKEVFINDRYTTPKINQINSKKEMITQYQNSTSGFKNLSDFDFSSINKSQSYIKNSETNNQNINISYTQQNYFSNKSFKKNTLSQSSPQFLSIQGIKGKLVLKPLNKSPDKKRNISQLEQKQQYKDQSILEQKENILDCKKSIENQNYDDNSITTNNQLLKIEQNKINHTSIDIDSKKNNDLLNNQNLLNRINLDIKAKIDNSTIIENKYIDNYQYTENQISTQRDNQILQDTSIETIKLNTQFSKGVYKKTTNQLNEDIKLIQNNFNKIKDSFLTYIYNNAEYILEKLEEYNYTSHIVNIKKFANFVLEIVQMIFFPKFNYSSYDDISKQIELDQNSLYYKLNDEIIEKIILYLQNSLISACKCESIQEILSQFQIICRKYLLGSVLSSSIPEQTLDNILHNTLKFLQETPVQLSQEKIEQYYPQIQEFWKAVLEENTKRIIINIRSVELKISFTSMHFFLLKLSLQKALRLETTLDPRIKTKIFKKVEKIRCFLFPIQLFSAPEILFKLKDNLNKNQKYKIVFTSNLQQRWKKSQPSQYIPNNVINALQGTKSLLYLHTSLKKHTSNQFPKESTDCVSIIKEAMYEVLKKSSEVNITLQLKDIEYKLLLMIRIYDLQTLDDQFINVSELIQHFKKWMEDKLQIFLLTNNQNAIKFSQSYFDFFEFLIFSLASKEENYSVYDIESAKQYFNIESTLFKIFLNELTFFLLKYNYSKQNIKLFIQYVQKFSMLI